MHHSSEEHTDGARDVGTVEALPKDPPENNEALHDGGTEPCDDDWDAENRV